MSKRNIINTEMWVKAKKGYTYYLPQEERSRNGQLNQSYLHWYAEEKVVEVQYLFVTNNTWESKNYNYLQNKLQKFLKVQRSISVGENKKNRGDNRRMNRYQFYYRKSERPTCAEINEMVECMLRHIGEIENEKSLGC